MIAAAEGRSVPFLRGSHLDPSVHALPWRGPRFRGPHCGPVALGLEFIELRSLLQSHCATGDCPSFLAVAIGT